MIDALKQFLPIAQKSKIADELGLASAKDQPYALLTLHRPSNVDSAETLAALLEAIAEIGHKIP